MAMNVHNEEFARENRCLHIFCISVCPKNVLEGCYCN